MTERDQATDPVDDDGDTIQDMELEPEEAGDVAGGSSNFDEASRR